MSPEEIRRIIEKYVKAYNSFDVEGMIQLLHKDIVFRNFSNGELQTVTRGTEAFRELAEQSSQMFSSRRQTLTAYRASGDQAEVQIDYEGRLAIDLPNGLKAGDTLQLKGKSVFEIKEGRIALIQDYS
ncbi:nuclear transport factor 2 family protein [Paenibacillus spiritus]|uniref:Nuclear transport factor 2 family protein n=1 Tax=Paenibacillus spiritus TaxID=2496557 RepID=A0A5J5GAR3_9BACL|nr:nuclear transport factor 2 family protein [Paenibacillus spiritus]KAA9005020.1 nuclear transport factor 2 family protein [Paenibacillus spiritus]